MSAKHTPGPWLIEKDGSAEHRNKANVIRGADGTMIVYGQANDADARLIAAAPDLLDALQVMLDAAQHDITQECDIARAAIAKAIG